MFGFFKNKKLVDKKSIKDKLETIKKKNEIVQVKLENIASSNNSGIDLEKKGDIDGAIEIYEQNIKARGAATHAYDRLMILYRKRMDYLNEGRVIKIAIEVFSKENEIRLQKALVKAKSESKKKEILNAFEKFERVLGDDGWWIYNPYLVNKYKSRLEKVNSLMNK
jgi:tetratricopeptide (TPR) repeat protein